MTSFLVVDSDFIVGMALLFTWLLADTLIEVPLPRCVMVIDSVVRSPSRVLVVEEVTSDVAG